MREEKFWRMVMIGFLLLFPTALICRSWYAAGLQSAAYKREGIEISQWECWFDVKPATRKLLDKN